MVGKYRKKIRKITKIDLSNVIFEVLTNVTKVLEVIMCKTKHYSRILPKYRSKIEKQLISASLENSACLLIIYV